MGITCTVIEIEMLSFLKKKNNTSIICKHFLTTNKRIVSIWPQIMITSMHDVSSVT